MLRGKPTLATVIAYTFFTGYVVGQKIGMGTGKSIWDKYPEWQLNAELWSWMVLIVLYLFGVQFGDVLKRLLHR